MDEELADGALLLELLEESGRSSLVKREKDPPDLEFRMSERRLVSIEHTRIFRPADQKGVFLQSEESERDILVGLAQTKLRQTNLPPAHIAVDFRDVYGLGRHRTLMLNKSKRDDLSEAICQIVTRFMPRDGEQRFLTELWKEPYPEEIEHVFIWRSSKLSTIQVVADGGASIPPLTPQLIADRIASKKKGLHSYRRDYGENWLLLVESTGMLSTEFDFEFGLSDAALSNEYEAGFNRIFLLRRVKREVLELKSKRPDA